MIDFLNPTQKHNDLIPKHVTVYKIAACHKNSKTANHNHIKMIEILCDGYDSPQHSTTRVHKNEPNPDMFHRP